LLGVGGLVFRGVWQSDGGAIDDTHPVSAPKILLGYCPAGFGNQSGVDVVEDFQGDGGAGLAVRTVFDRRHGMSGDPTKSGGLTDGLTTGSARLSDLPEESPEGESKSPTTAAGMGAFVALGKKMMGDPTLEKDLELVEESSGPAGGGIVAKLVEMIGESRREAGKVRSH
jgi:hypothetical protein